MRVLDKKRELLALITALMAVIVLSGVVCITFGPVDIESTTVFKIITNRLFKSEVYVKDWSTNIESIIWNLRVPRILLCMISGAGLSLAGIMMQAITKNPIAEPYILGISSGASAGAVSAILLGAFSGFGTNGIAVGAFLGALASITIVFSIAGAKGQFTPVRLILTGVATSAVFSSFTSFIVFNAKDMSKVKSAMFWMAGSLAGAKWYKLALPSVVLIAAVLFCIINSKALDMMLLGDNVAKTMGVNVKKTRNSIILMASLLTAAVVSTCGVIGFVGLIIPHMSRTIVGSAHKRLVPVAIMFGSIFMIWTDTMARTIAAPEEIPIGIVTSLFGAPFFMYLVSKSGYSFGGK